ncbi:MAG TPA: hypothetical protein VH575_34045 [Gemmataceae bacterium]|jgi:hypothetical protein
MRRGSYSLAYRFLVPLAIRHFGLAAAGGFKMQVQDRSGLVLEALQGFVANVIDKGNSQPADPVRGD